MTRFLLVKSWDLTFGKSMLVLSIFTRPQKKLKKKTWIKGNSIYSCVVEEKLKADNNYFRISKNGTSVSRINSAQLPYRKQVAKIVSLDASKGALELFLPNKGNWMTELRSKIAHLFAWKMFTWYTARIHPI